MKMFPKVFFILFMFVVSFHVEAQTPSDIDPDIQKIRREANSCFEMKNYSCAKANYNTLLKINKQDAEAIKQLKVIEQLEKQLGKNRSEKPRPTVQYENAIKGNYGTIKGLYDHNFEKYDYQGFIKNGLPHGKGTAHYQPYCTTCGEEYGEWVNGKREGEFKAYYPSKSRYVATYKNDKAEGSFTFYAVSGERYEYFYKNGKKEGVQKIFYPNGNAVSVYTINDNVEGNAVYYYKDGLRAVGYFKDGDLVEITRFETDSFKMTCKLYKGQKDKSPVSIEWADKSRFEGDMVPVNNQYLYAGTLTISEGEILEASFYLASGKLQILDGKVRSSYKGNMYEGEFKNGGMNGKGVLTFSNGDIYSGEFKDNHMNGYGVYAMPDGYFFDGIPGCNQYEGNYINGSKEGLGKCYKRYYNPKLKRTSFELIYGGQFKNDKPVGKYAQKKTKK